MENAEKNLTGILNKSNIGGILLIVQKQAEKNPAIRKLLTGIALSDILEIYKLLNSGTVKEIQITLK